MTTTLAGFGYTCKQQAAKRLIWQSTAVSLKDLFRKRLQEEMEAQSLSANGLARRCRQGGHHIGQTTISAILRGKQGPSMENIEILSYCLGVPAWFLFTESRDVEQKVIKPPHNVVRLPAPYPKIFPTGKRPDDQTRPRVAKKRR